MHTFMSAQCTPMGMLLQATCPMMLSICSQTTFILHQGTKRDHLTEGFFSSFFYVTPETTHTCKNGVCILKWGSLLHIRELYFFLH